MFGTRRLECVLHATGHREGLSAILSGIQQTNGKLKDHHSDPKYELVFLPLLARVLEFEFSVSNWSY